MVNTLHEDIKDNSDNRSYSSDNTKDNTKRCQSFHERTTQVATCPPVNFSLQRDRDTTPPIGNESLGNKLISPAGRHTRFEPVAGTTKHP